MRQSITPLRRTAMQVATAPPRPTLWNVAHSRIAPTFWHVAHVRVLDCEKNSSYWRANVAQTPDTALFFLATAKPDYLKAAPGGSSYMTDEDLIPQGKNVFAERCARCHSSKLPENVFNTYFKAGCIGPNYMKCWNDYWTYTKTAEFKTVDQSVV